MSFHQGTEAAFLESVRKYVGSGAQARANAAELALEAADRFCWQEHWMMLVGDVKGDVLDKALNDRIQTLNGTRGNGALIAVELGTYVGYSAVRISRLLPEGSLLYTCDADAGIQKLASQFVSLAGLQHKVEFLNAYAKDALRFLRDQRIKVDFIFLDHEKDDYLPSLLYLERHDMLNDGAVVVADNVVVFNIGTYLDYVRQSGRYQSRCEMSALEYTPWARDGAGSILDGVEVSVFSPNRGSGHVAASGFGRKSPPAGVDVDMPARTRGPGGAAFQIRPPLRAIWQ